jgi:hypothetical protein
MNVLTHVTSKQLLRASKLKARIDKLQDKMNDLLGLSAQKGNGAAPVRKKYRMSRAGRAAIAAAARARWAKYNKGRVESAKPGRKPGRKMSAASRAKMAAAARARWKAAKAAGKTRL